MGCGCKGDKKSPQIDYKENEENEEFNLVGKLLKIPTILLLSVLIIVISPLLLIMCWYIAFRAVFSDNFNILNFLLKNYKRLSPNLEEEFDEDDYNEDDYEMVGVEVIK